ncbi:hypothetical protein [Thermoactinomyces mirandus]|uniref:Uncharacterized protein n=1 Tax=Thermoactinomyces mirandus TaxID=2756294 RepID=A0A7W2AR54_9BACL|nr:hypothetical protein [Thermoactinomyces mirandus]MBA4601220.1 hypothetical protein [Thermoactinomyces mirandus]
MGKVPRHFMILFSLVWVGMNCLFPAEVFADRGFQVPEIQEDFGQYDRIPEPQENTELIQQNTQEETGTWDWITEPVAQGWKWAEEKIAAAWNWMKETASDAWDGIVGVISRIADVVVDALSAAWNWILEHKEIVITILSILGVIIAVIGFVIEAPLALIVGAGILLGELISGFISLISGNELFSDEMLLDMLIGGIAGGISALFGWAAGAGAAGSSVVRWLGTRIPWLGRIFPKMFGGGVGAGVDQSLWDLLRNGKINWKRTVIAAGLGFVLVFGGEYVGSHLDDIIKWINNRNIPSFAQSFVRSGNSAAMTAPKRVGDTPFGQWLQKFAAEGGGSGSSTLTIKATIKAVDGKEYLLFGDNPVAKYKKGNLSRINTDMAGGRERARKVFKQLAKGRQIQWDKPKKDWARVEDEKGELILQFRTKNDGSTNIDVKINGVYEDIHFKP